MSSFMWAFLCVLGLCWGSFLNVVIVRGLSGESIIFPGSKCPKCDVPLLWWQNIPVFSYFYLKGRCAFCNAPISPLYPVIEIAGMIIFLFSFSHYPSFFDAISVVAILSMFLTLAVTDIKQQKVSRFQTFIIMGAGIIFSRYNIINSVSGALIGAGLVILLTKLGLKLFNKETFGVGDIYLLAALGAVVGLDRLFLFIVYALILQVIIILPEYIISLWRNEQSETLKYLIFFIIACLFLYVLRNISFIGSKLLFIGLLAAILYFAAKLTKNLFTTLKTQQTVSYCPIAPAIAISCLLFLI